MTGWTIRLLSPATEAIKGIKDTRVRRKLVERIEELRQDPLIRTKPLTGELKGLRSARAVGQRYRIIVAVDEPTATITVLLVGIRKEGDKVDVYRLAQKLFSTKRF